MREKLVSEVKTNRDKAKKTTSECIIDVFSNVCHETSLATLKIYFPPVVSLVNPLIVSFFDKNLITDRKYGVSIT